VVLITILYNSSVLPFRAAFGEVFYNSADSATVGFLIFFDYLCDAIYLLDILVHFRTSFYHKGLLVDNTKEVSKRYAKGYFTLDLLASIPLELFVLVWKWKDPSIVAAQGMSLLRFNRILRLVRYFVYFEYWARYSKFPNAVR
jgi:cyclic nucleotide gated channel alpha 3